MSETQTKSLLLELEKEIESLQKEIPSLSGDSLYKAAKRIVQCMDSQYCIQGNMEIDNLLTPEEKHKFKFQRGSYKISIYAKSQEEAKDAWDQLQERNYYPTGGVYEVPSDREF